MLDLFDYEPKWNNFTVVVSEYKPDKGSTLPLIRRFTPDGSIREQIYLQMVPKNQAENFLSQGWKHIGDIPDNMAVLMR